MYAQREKHNENKSREIANSVYQKQNSNTAVFKYLDNRPEATAQRKIKKMINQKEKPLQRMVAIARDNMSTIDDPLILSNLDYAKGHFGNPVGDFSANRKFDQMGECQQIGIVEHGLPGAIGNYNGNQVAEILTSPDNHIPKSTTSVVLYSCFAAAEKAGPKSSLVQELSAALKTKGYEIGVEGQVGVGFGFEGIGERTTKGDFQTGVLAWVNALAQLLGDGKKYETWRGGENSLSAFGIQGNMYHLVTSNVLLEKIGQFTTIQIGTMSIEEKATHISKIMAPFWRDAEKAMGSKLHNHLEGWLRVKSYVSGDEFVQRTGI